MTGYGDASTTIGGVHYFVEVRSLNNKYFKASIRLAEALQGLGVEMEARLREKLSRGTVTLTARSARLQRIGRPRDQHQGLARYIEQLRQIPEVKSGEVKLDVAQLLSLPGVQPRR